NADTRITRDGAVVDTEGTKVAHAVRIAGDGAARDSESAVIIIKYATPRRPLPGLPEMMLFLMVRAPTFDTPGNPPLIVRLRSVRFPELLTSIRLKKGAFA